MTDSEQEPETGLSSGSTGFHMSREIAERASRVTTVVSASGEPPMSVVEKIAEQVAQDAEKAEQVAETPVMAVLTGQVPVESMVLGKLPDPGDAALLPHSMQNEKARVAAEAELEAEGSA